MSNIGTILTDNGDYKNAITILHEALKIGYEYNLNQVLLRSYLDLSESYFFTRQYTKAFLFRERAAKMNNHILNIDRFITLDDLAIKYQTARKEKELALAKNENLIISQRLEYNKWVIIVLVLGMVSITSVSYNYQQKQRLAKITAIQKQWQLEQKLDLMKKEKQLSSLKSFFVGQEKERRRIAEDLHDSLGGLLYALNFQIMKARNLPFYPKMNQVLHEAIEENRRISQNLVPPTLNRLGLVSALKEWILKFEDQFELLVEMNISNLETKLPDEIRLSSFRIIQELLNNAGKHAQADQVELSLIKKDNELEIKVQDDGIGFDINKQPSTFLKTVQSRVEILNGNLKIQSEIGRGSTVIVKFNLTI